MPRIVYRGGSDSDDNLTPRPKDVELERDKTGRSPGLSVFASIDQAVEPGAKAQGIDLDEIDEPLRPFPDDSSLEGGVVGHLSLAPVTAEGQIDQILLNEWADTRQTGRVH